MKRPDLDTPTLLLATSALALLSACASPELSHASPDYTGPMNAPTSVSGTAPGHSTMTNARPDIATSPLTLRDLELLSGSLLFGEDDVAALRLSLPLVEEHADEILDVWYGFVASTPQLVQYFADADSGAPDHRYLAEVRKRFKQWIFDTARAEYDQDWLDYQHEIGLRHHSTKKNRTDGVSSVPIIHFRYLPALVYPVTATLKPFLERGDHSPEDVERMHQAWIKSVLLQSILWSHPYVNEGEF